MNRLVLATACAWAATACLISPAFAQESKPQEGKLGADLRLEGAALASKCDDVAPKKLIDCATTLITDHPFHLAIGSLAPQNGFGFGLAFVAPQSKPNDDWRINWSADVVGTPSAAWRAGVVCEVRQFEGARDRCRGSRRWNIEWERAASTLSDVCALRPNDESAERFLLRPRKRDVCRRSNVLRDARVDDRRRRVLADCTKRIVQSSESRRAVRSQRALGARRRLHLWGRSLDRHAVHGSHRPRAEYSACDAASQRGAADSARHRPASADLQRLPAAIRRTVGDLRIIPQMDARSPTRSVAVDDESSEWRAGYERSQRVRDVGRSAGWRVRLSRSDHHHDEPRRQRWVSRRRLFLSGLRWQPGAVLLPTDARRI